LYYYYYYYYYCVVIYTWVSRCSHKKKRLTGTTTGFLRAGCPSCCSNYNVKAWQENPVVWSSFDLQTWYHQTNGVKALKEARSSQAYKELYCKPWKKHIRP